MKNVLNYQSSEYDCSSTTLTNALRYLFERREIAPEMLKAIALYTLDAYNAEGESGKSSTCAWRCNSLPTGSSNTASARNSPSLPHS